MFWRKLKSNKPTLIFPHSFSVLMKRFTFFSCWFLFFCISANGQKEVVKDSLSADSVIVVNNSLLQNTPVVESTTPEKVKKSGPIRNFFKKDYPNPTKAMIFSLVIPGTGQLYNKKYWKVPIVWGAYGLMIYFIDFSSGQYKYFKEEYIVVVNGGESPLVTQNGWGEDDIKYYRDLYRKRMELSYIGLVAVTLLSGIDAYVDAHLMGFDVSEDLTMHIRPKYDFIPDQGSSLGVGLSFHFNNSKAKPKVFFESD